MNVPTDVQIIEQGGKPAFAVVPYDQWLEMISERDENILFPDEVVGYHFEEGLSLIAAWRKYKNLSQKDLADKLGITQPAMAQIEKPGAKPQRKTLQKVAAALGLSVQQLTLDD